MSSNLPYNQGIKAFQNNLGTHLNPYDESDFRYRDWLLGYSNAELGKNELASVNVKYMMRIVDPEPLAAQFVK